MHKDVKMTHKATFQPLLSLGQTALKSACPFRLIPGQKASESTFFFPLGKSSGPVCKAGSFFKGKRLSGSEMAREKADSRVALGIAEKRIGLPSPSIDPR